MNANRHRIVTLNCGLGRDSVTMVCLAIERKLRCGDLGTVGPADIDTVVFSDTGCEWAHTYEAVDEVASLCEANGLRFTVLAKPTRGAGARELQPESWDELYDKAEAGGYHIRPPLMADYQSRATVASLGKGDCTDNHKIQPIRRMINDISVMRFGANNREWSPRVSKGEALPHVTMIGIAADETARLSHGSDRAPVYVVEAYPLVTMKIAKPDERPILRRFGLDHIRKSGCFCCPYQPAGWYWALSVTDKRTWAAVVRYEQIALARNKNMNVTGLKLKGEMMRLPEVVARWRKANPDATVDEVLDKQYTRCTAEARQAARVAEAEMAAVR